ncbi:hypothetical protein CVS30_17175 [Arthrobacter psychrolactophilus]|uniref:Low temperature requirement protein A n=1 Tax=Arthrobacter psychrolactophilus TaxID=92442 RepID=A0A2V5JJ39_9MICC|nr:hypothetical protein CVS30_17175 [Arthrobacter psychrolactophilus]
MHTCAVAAFISAFAGTAALWWLYFSSTREVSERSLLNEESRTGRARDIYTYGHVLIVAGPVVFLFTQLALQLRATNTLGYSRLAAVTACVAIGLLGNSLLALLIGAMLVMVLIAVALLDHGGPNKARRSWDGEAGTATAARQ